jgi:hypothetical protein
MREDSTRLRAQPSRRTRLRRMLTSSRTPELFRHMCSKSVIVVVGMKKKAMKCLKLVVFVLCCLVNLDNVK